MNIIAKIIDSKLNQRLKRKLVVLSKVYLKVKKLSPSISEDMRTSMLLNYYNIDKVLDVGANTGQFAESLIDFGYTGKIVSFEPVTSAYNVLSKRARSYPEWEIAEKCAIGDITGKIDINVSESTVFSSIKEIKTEFTSKETKAETIKKESVDIFTLDSLENKYYNGSERIFLKVDTQGFEKEVFTGAEKLLKKIIGLKLEIPLRGDLSVYKDVEWDLHYYINYLYSLGFKCVSLDTISANKETGIVYEVDGIFFRDN